jgi:hypothetical protein
MTTRSKPRRPLFPFLFTTLFATAGVACRNGSTSAEGGSGTSVHAEVRSSAMGDRHHATVAGRSADARRVLTFEGTCDASGAVELDDRTLVIADDENNSLRVYDAERGGRPLHEFDVSQALGLEKPHKAESDFEAGTRAGDRAYFIASHGRTSKGKRDTNRLVFFAATLPRDGQPLSIVGEPYRELLDDLTTDPKLAAFRLEQAAQRAPKEPDGMNIEGMTSQPDGSVLLGFRSPVPGGRALLVRLLNPDAVIRGEKAKLSDPVRLDLGGLGVRALSSWNAGYLIVAGPSGDGGPFKLFRGDEEGALAVPGVDLEGFGAEALFTPDTGDQVLVLSDDGTRLVEGRPCKKLRDPSKKSFRGVWVRLPR